MGIKKIFQTLRREYSLKPFNLAQTKASPFALFDTWIKEAAKSGVWDVNAMTLATLDKAGRPVSRIVLLKGFDRRGFVFFTNYDSDKGLQLKKSSSASLLFFWPELIRQVRVEGKVEKTSKAENEAYFRTRPRGSQIAAWASPQSRLMEEGELKERVKEIEARFKGKKIPCPPFWGGYRLVPRRFEFWHGRLNRLHDRFAFTKKAGRWKAVRLAP